jgi:hypothetical protein
MEPTPIQRALLDEISKAVAESVERLWRHFYLFEDLRCSICGSTTDKQRAERCRGACGKDDLFKDVERYEVGADGRFHRVK